MISNPASLPPILPETPLSSGSRATSSNHFSKSDPPLTSISSESPPSEDFSRFVQKDTEWVTGRQLLQTRRQLFQQTLNDLKKFRDVFSIALNDCATARIELANKIQSYPLQFKPFKRQGLELQRKIVAIGYLVLKTEHKSEILKWKQTDRKLQRTVRFMDFLEALRRKTEILPLIHIDGFLSTFSQLDPELETLEQHLMILRANCRPVIALKEGSGDFIFNLLHPKSTTGKIISRFEERVHLLTYNEVSSIVKRLSNREASPIVENLLFDLAWGQKSYPFGMSPNGRRKISFPLKGELFPAVIGQTVLNHEWSFTPFSILNGLQWPFKDAVDTLWEMMILTNPFQIAKAYWDFLQEVTHCITGILVGQGQRAEDIEIDFDSLFPLLIICVFAFGVDEWIQVALYAMSFSEHAVDDAELMFSMTMLEGLVTQILALDFNDLRQKAVGLRKTSGK